jgi:hypothetical protein
LERLDRPGDRAGSLGGGGFQAFVLVGDRVGGSGQLETAVDLGADHGRGDQIIDFAT